jgi:hypothetical protein
MERGETDMKVIGRKGKTPNRRHRNRFLAEAR